MSATDALLICRYAEIALIVWAIHWVIWTMPAGAYRTKRLIIAFVLLAFNILALMIRAFWLKNPLW